jgi:hypothetical protein
MLEQMPSEPLTAKDTIQMASLAVGTIGGLIAACMALRQARFSSTQRADELKWKKASMARDLITEIHRSEHASAAVQMLDWWGCEAIQIAAEGRSATVSTERIRRVLGCERASLQDPTDQLIWNSFDWFLYYLDRVVHFETIGLVQEGDVLPVFKPYLRKIGGDFELFEPLLTHQMYEGARRLVEPFRSFRVESAESG